MDFIRLIIPYGPGSETYILLVVDYTTRFLFARTLVVATTTNILVFVSTSIV